MLLIRGFNQERYAREINTGTIGFHDLLTTLLYHENNGYKLSDYYEESIIRAAAKTSVFALELENVPFDIANQLSLIFNPFIPHFYLSYFHILNDKSEMWLEKNFDEDSYFVYAIPRLQKLDMLDEMMYGRNMIGSRMVYLPKDGIAYTPQMVIQKAGIVHLMQNELDACRLHGSATLENCMVLNDMIIAVCCEVFARRCNGQYDESENEFRIIYKTPTPYSPMTGFFEPTEDRPFSAMVDGIQYEGALINEIFETTFTYRTNMLLETKNPMIAEPMTSIKEVFDKKRDFKVLPYFKPVTIKRSFQEYGYIGNKEQCRRFIATKLKEGT